MLRKIRIVAAVLFFLLITLLFLDFTGTLHAWFGWMAKIQFLPALLAVNVGVVLALVALTLLFGRVYCSVICPLGVMQDIVSWFAGRRKKHRYRFSYSPALTWLRWTMLAVFVAAMLAGVGWLIAPYSAYGRIASNLFAPIYAWGNNGLAWIAERMDSYAFYSVEVWMESLGMFLIAVVTFAGLSFLAWRSGRTWCNTVCPVGTLLGVLSRRSLFRPRFDVSKCNGCNRSYGLSRILSSGGHHLYPAAAGTAVGFPCRGTSDRRFAAPVLRCAGALRLHRPACAGEEGRWRTGRDRGEEDPGPCRADPASGSAESAPLHDALHLVPVVRVGLPESGAAPFGAAVDADEARDVV